MKNLEQVLFVIIVSLMGHVTFGQSIFMDYNNKSFSGKDYIGKEIYQYEGNNIRLYDPEYKSITIKLSDLENHNYAAIVDDLNANPNLILVTFDYSGGFKKRSLKNLKSFPFDSLRHIQHLYIRQFPQVFDSFRAWEKIAEMPSLEYLLLAPSYPLEISQEIQNVLWSKLKGLSIKSSRMVPNFSISSIEELSISTKKEDSKLIFGSFTDQSKIEKLRLNIDTLTKEVYDKILNLPNLTWLDLGAKHFAHDVTNINSERKNWNHLVLYNPPVNFLGSLNSDLKNLELFFRKQKAESVINEIEKFNALENLVLTLNYKEDSILNLNFKSFPVLKNLKINGRLKSISPTLEKLKQLEKLELKYHNLTDGNINFCKLKKLKHLDLSGNKFRKISLKGLSELETLNLSRNQLMKFPKGLSSLLKLEKLYLQNNDIIKIPIEILKLSSLKVLSVGNNFIGEMPSSISKLSKLEYFNAENNCLLTIPSDIGEIKTLKKLGLSNFKPYTSEREKEKPRKQQCSNDIQNLPKSLIYASNLESLNLKGNPSLDEGDVSMVLQIPSEKLDAILSNCNIYSLPKEGWESSMIKTLSLSSNSITSLPNAFFKNKISSVNLNSNDLGIYDQEFKDPTHLKLMAYDRGLITKDELLECDDLLKVIVDVSSRFYSNVDENPILKFLPIALELDSAYVFQNLDAENYAEALYDAGSYEEAITYFSITIDAEMSSKIRFANSIASHYNKRHRSYLEVGDTLSAIDDLKVIKDEFGFNTDPQIFSLLYNLGRFQESQIFADSAIVVYQKLLDKNPDKFDSGIALSILELYLLTDRNLAFSKYSISIANEVFNSPYDKIFEYLILLNSMSRSKKINIESEVFIHEFNQEKYQNKSWNCALVEKWASTKSADIEKHILSLNNLICPN